MNEAQLRQEFINSGKTEFEVNQIFDDHKRKIAGNTTRQERYFARAMNDIGKPPVALPENDDSMRASNQRYADRMNSETGELTGYDCQLCKNRGEFWFVNEYDALGVCCCECQKVRESLRLIKASGLETAIEQNTFENFKTENELQKAMKSKALEYLGNDHKQGNGWILYAGQSGVGKTHLCTAICGKLLQQGTQVVYLTYRDEIPKLKRNTLDDRYYSQKMRLWQECAVLYIDDLFKGKITEVDINLLFELLDYRVRNRLRTIISTELSTQELIGIDEALGGRILQQCGKFVVQIAKDKAKNYRTRSVVAKNTNTQAPSLPYKDDTWDD